MHWGVWTVHDMGRFCLKLGKNKRGSSLVEILIVMAIFSIISLGVVTSFVSSIGASKQGVEYAVAAGYITEGIEAVRSIRDRQWSEITNGTHGLTTTSGYYEFLGTSNTLGLFTRTITIEDVTRPSPLGDISPTGVIDTNTKKVTVNVTWDTRTAKTQNIDAVFYVMSWGIGAWTQSLDSDFLNGYLNSTEVTVVSDGEISLQAGDAAWSSVRSAYSLDLDGVGDRVAVDYDDVHDILYVLSESTVGNEFEAIDVSNVSQTTPTVIGGMELTGMIPSDLVVHDGYAYVASNKDDAEVTVIDVATMTQVNTIDLTGAGDATAVAAFGTTLGIVRLNNPDEEVYFYDISDPDGVLTELSSSAIAFDVYAIAITQTHAYLGTADNATEILVFQLSDYTQINTVDLSGNSDAISLDVYGNLLVAGKEDLGDEDIFLIDIASPSSIPTPTAIEISEQPTDIDVDERGEFVMIATPGSGNSDELVIVDIGSASVAATYDATDDFRGVATYGGYVYLCGIEDSAELEIFTAGASGWAAPTAIATIDKNGSNPLYDIDIEGNFLYLGADVTGLSDELFIYDISTPSSPAFLGSLNTGSIIYGVDAVGDYVYLATSDNSRELDVIDVSTKTSPVRAGSLDLNRPNDAYDVVVDGDYAYLVRDRSNQPEFYVIDVSTPSSPSLTGTYEAGVDLNAVTKEGDYVYIASDDNNYEVTVIDVSTPASPSFAGGYDLTGSTNGNAITINGTLLAVGRESGGSEFALLDATTPTALSLYSETVIGDKVNSISFDGTDALFIGADQTGSELQRWNIALPATPHNVFSLNIGSDVMGTSFDGTYIYAGTEDSAAEVQIFGAATGSITDYAPEGTWTSVAFDTQSSGTIWKTIDWTESGTGDIKFRLRTADTEAHLADAAWVGSDGTGDTYYEAAGGTITVDSGASGTQWAQLKLYISGDRLTTPALESISLNYVPYP